MCSYIASVQQEGSGCSGAVVVQKFFLRSAKGAASKYSCTGPASSRCEITRNTRTRCQYCRYDKCKSIGMLLPGAPRPPSHTHELPYDYEYDEHTHTHTHTHARTHARTRTEFST